MSKAIRGIDKMTVLAFLVSVSYSAVPQQLLSAATLRPSRQSVSIRTPSSAEVLTRRKLAQFIYKRYLLQLAGNPATLTTKAPDDVSENDADYVAIQTLRRLGVMNDYRSNQFFPNTIVTRVEAFSAIVQALGRAQLNSSSVNRILSGYADAKEVPIWARQAIANALEQGWIDVDANRKIAPLAPMTSKDLDYLLKRQGLSQQKPAKVQPATPVPIPSTKESVPFPMNGWFWIVLFTAGGALGLGLRGIQLGDSSQRSTLTPETNYTLKLTEFDHLTNRMLAQENLPVFVDRRIMIGSGEDCDYSVQSGDDLPLQPFFSIALLSNQTVQILPIASTPIQLQLGKRELMLRKHRSETVPLPDHPLQVVCQDRRFLLEFVPSTVNPMARDALAAHLTQNSSWN